jgi:nucleoid-associated protein YgaU
LDNITQGNVGNPIQFHLSYDNGAGRLRLPVNPASIKIADTHGFQDVQAAQLGEITVIGNRALSDISFSSLFPRDYDPAYCAYTPMPDPWRCVDLIQRWMRSKKPIRLTVTGTPINYAVTIRSFNIDPERGGSPGDIYYDIAFKEYVFVNFRKVEVSAKQEVRILSAASVRPNTAAKVTRYTVVSGDSLWKIAQRYLNDGDKWRTIYNANKAVVGANPNLIFPGQTLVIPQ